MQYDIFISYRREGSFETANLIADRLKHAGYRVFFDVESLKSGKFNEQLYLVIQQCHDFILVLPENGLDRCNNEDDWLRLEILHALKYKKNIIPVTLRGFKFPQNMPAGMEELVNYQAVIANSFEYFDASIVKLKSYLKSRSGITLKRYKKQITGIIAALVFLSGFLGYRYYQDKKLLERVCCSEMALMGIEFVSMNLALKEATNAKNEWDNYLLKFGTANPRDTAFIRKQFVAFIDFKINIFPKAKNLTLSPESSVILSEHGIKPEEIVAFYSSLCPLFNQQIHGFLTSLKIYARMPFVSEAVKKSVQLDHEVLVLSAKSTYYAYLGFLTTMPSAVYNDEFYKIRSELDLYRDIPINKTLKEYESDQEGIDRAIERKVTQMGKEATDDLLVVERVQYGLDQNRKDFEKAVLSKEAANLNDKKLRLDLQRAELAKKQIALDEMYKKLLEKCSFEADEDEGLMWGKILRLVTNARNATRIRFEEKVQLELNRQEAIRNGIDPSTLTESIYLVSLDEMYIDIFKRLDLVIQYKQKENPHVNEYIQAAKQYLKLLKKGEIEDSGVLVVGTKDNAIHPVLKVGDIVVERKGKPVFTTNDYSKIKSEPGPNTLKILRFSSDGQKSIITETVPETNILVGLANLREID